MTLRFVPVTEEHLVSFSLRPADATEVLLSRPDASPSVVVRESVALSIEACAAVDGDEVVALFGLAEAPQHLAYPWMLSAPSVGRHGVQALRVGRAIVAWWKRRTQGKLLCNYVHRENTSAIRYIQRLGAVVVPSPTGPFDFFYFPHV